MEDYRNYTWSERQPIRAIERLLETPGLKLPNGAVLLAEEIVREFDFRRDSIVLAVNPGGYQPFVTWNRLVTSDSPLATGGFQIVSTTAYGDYYRTLDEARKSFKARVAEKVKMFDLDGELI